MVRITPRPLFTPRKDPVPIVQEAGWAPGLVWTGAENTAPTGIRYPDRPARSQSLYRLSYPARHFKRPIPKLCHYETKLGTFWRPKRDGQKGATGNSASDMDRCVDEMTGGPTAQVKDLKIAKAPKTAVQVGEETVCFKIMCAVMK